MDLPQAKNEFLEINSVKGRRREASCGKEVFLEGDSSKNVLEEGHLVKKIKKRSRKEKDLQDCLNLVPSSCFSWYSIRLYQENSRKEEGEDLSRVLGS